MFLGLVHSKVSIERHHIGTGRCWVHAWLTCTYNERISGGGDSSVGDEFPNIEKNS